METKQICPACLDTGTALSLRLTEGYRLYQCEFCRTQYFRPDRETETSETVSEYWEEYKFQVYADPDVRHEYARRFDGALNEARRHIGTIESALDVGCGIGNFLEHCEPQGIRAYGIDVDQSAVAAARKRGLAVATSDELEHLVRPEDRGVDAVTMWDVIEHLYEPDAVVQEIIRVLRSDGALILETPDGGFPVRRAILGLHSASRGRLDFTAPFYYWEHKIYFSETGIRLFLARHNLRTVSVLRWTSPREKLGKTFNHYAKRSGVQRLLSWLWPALETVFRYCGSGNKLIVVAQLNPTSSR